MNADYIELQGMIDQAVKDNSTVEVTRRYVVDEPLKMVRFEDGVYKNHSAKIVGNCTMWDVSEGNIIGTFSGAPVLSVHKGKGNIIRGLNVRGAGVGRDSKYSADCCLAIDPVSGVVPADGGYPLLKEDYKGDTSRGGSTGIRVEDCTFQDSTLACVTSINGYTQNAEMLTFQNNRIGKVKYGIVGCQAQEKMNRVINLGAWERCDTLFVFNKYGQGTPGQWTMQDISTAGYVDHLVYRDSHEWFPLIMTNVVAEELISIGHWFSYLSDRLDNSKIDFRHPDGNSPLPKSHLDGGMIVSNSTIRYYGRPELPIVLTPSKDRGIEETNVTYSGKVVRPYYVPDNVKVIGQQVVDSSYVKGVKENDVVMFFNPVSNFYEGVAMGKSKNQIQFSSLTDNREYIIGKL